MMRFYCEMYRDTTYKCQLLLAYKSIQYKLILYKIQMNKSAGYYNMRNISHSNEEPQMLHMAHARF